MSVRINFLVFCKNYIYCKTISANFMGSLAQKVFRNASRKLHKTFGVNPVKSWCYLNILIIKLSEQISY